MTAGLAIVISSATLPLHVPGPQYHDEFCYFLAADTFASGRLTNPTHALWPHFESFHIIQRPTYMAKYPPAQGLLLAIGQLIGGHPILGVKISVALACAAICWMLQAWVPSRWAFLGGLMAITRIGGVGYWSQSYWGGAVAAFGGALVFGALRRIIRYQRARDSMVLAVGLGILANSRPFEGFVIGLPIALVLLIWMVNRNGPSASVAVRKVVLPTVLVLGFTLAAMGYYNFRGTGNPLQMPYQVHNATYEAKGRIFPWQSEKSEPSYNHEVMRKYYTEYAKHHKKVRKQTIPGLVGAVPWKSRGLWEFYLMLLLSVPLVTLPWIVRDRWTLFALANCLMLLVLMFTHMAHPHYAAPITCLIYLLVVQGVRYLCRWRWPHQLTGVCVFRGLGVAIVASFLLTNVLELDWELYLKRTGKRYYVHRERMMKKLNDMEGKHLVVVRYNPKHNPHNEWVYNDANIDDAKIVWAREMDRSQNTQLFNYFNSRKIWLLEADAKPPKLTPYHISE